ncbi:MAG TPA: hypothetical protein VGA80_17930 [Flavobacteriaceae bacterium]
MKTDLEGAKAVFEEVQSLPFKEIGCDLIIVSDSEGEVLAWTEESSRILSLSDYPFFQETVRGEKKWA